MGDQADLEFESPKVPQPSKSKSIPEPTHDGWVPRVRGVMPVSYKMLPRVNWKQFLNLREDKVDLRRVMGDFYLMNDMAQGEALPISLKHEWDQFLYDWDSRFQRYLLAACLGEFRHRKGKTWVRLVGKGKSHKKRSACQGGAMVLWLWYPDRPAMAAEAMSHYFGDSRYFPMAGSFGGPRWALMAKSLHRRILGHMPAAVFVDNAWDLLHNGGSLFDKCDLFEKEEECRDLLVKRARSGNLGDVLDHASSSVRTAWVKYRQGGGLEAAMARRERSGD